MRGSFIAIFGIYMSNAYHLKLMGQGRTMDLGQDSSSMCQGPPCGPSHTEATPTPTRGVAKWQSPTCRPSLANEAKLGMGMWQGPSFGPSHPTPPIYDVSKNRPWYH